MKYLFHLVAATILASFFAQGIARAQGYRVAHTSDGFASFDYAVINDSGEVVFAATKIVGGQSVHGVYKSAGGGFTTLIEGEVELIPFTGETFSASGPVAINSAGVVAIGGPFRHDGSTAVYVGTGAITAPQTVTETFANFPVMIGGNFLSADLSINDNKAVALGVLTFVPNQDPKASLGQIYFPFPGQGLDNKNERLLFKPGAPSGGGTGGSLYLVGFDFIIGTGGRGPLVLAPVYTNLIFTAPAGMTLEKPQVNGQGTVAFFAEKTDGTSGIYQSTGAPVVEGSQTGTTEFLLAGLGNFALNESGQIAFLARSHTWGGQSGFFRGPNPQIDKIVMEGDIVAGSPVHGLTSPQFNRGGHWFNSAGQIVFLADDQTGTGLYVTSDGITPPSPNSAVVDWDGKSSPPDSLFSDSSNWKPANGDPPRVPQKTDKLADIAEYALCTSLTVDVGQQTFERLVIKCGDVVFSDGDVTLAALSSNSPSLEIQGGSLTLDDGNVLHTSHAWIGSGNVGRLAVQPASSWQSQGRAEVGKDAYGSLVIGGLVHSAEARIGNGFGGGLGIVRGGGAVWTTGNIAVGFAGQGELDVESGGRVNSHNAVVGFGPGLGNQVIVTGAGNSGISSEWDVAGELDIGSAGAGAVEITDGGTNYVVGNVFIGVDVSASGTLKVSGVHSTGTPSSLSTVASIGVGAGRLTVEDGASVTTGGDLFVGASRPSTAIITGVNAATNKRSQLNLNGTLLVGDFLGGGGSLVIDQGGLVHCVSADIGNDPTAPVAKVDILGLGGTPASTLQVEQDLELGKVGRSTITLSNGRLEVGGTVTVYANGVIQGNGTLVAGHRIKQGGYISPGLSPGRLVLEGDYEQTTGGRLKIEVGGLDPGVSHDQFVVNGNATLDGTLELRFINGFAPKQGNTFNFLQVAGALSNGFASVEVKNLTPDFQFNVSTNGTNISLVAMNDGVFVTPLQGQISSSNVVTIGGISYLPYTLNVTNDCTIVEPAGAVTLQGQELFQTLSERSDPDCRGVSASVSRVLPLGALSPGSYQFHFMADGVVVHTVSFDVPAGTGQVLSFTRTAGGELNLQINGLDSVQYTIQASADLTDWFDVPAHVGTFLGPYNILDPFSASKARFYRVKIE